MSVLIRVDERIGDLSLFDKLSFGSFDSNQENGVYHSDRTDSRYEILHWKRTQRIEKNLLFLPNDNCQVPSEEGQAVFRS